MNVAVAIVGEADPLVEIFNVALNGTTDQVLASFERDLYREPMNVEVAIVGEADPLVEIFNVALSAEVGKTVKQVAIGGKNNRGS